MLRRCRTALLLSALSHAYSRPIEASPAVVRIEGWTTSGERVEKIWVAISSLDGRTVSDGNGRDVKLSVAPGEYLLWVGAPGFESNRQILRVYEPSVFRSVALQIVRFHGQPIANLTGMVRNYDGDIRNLRIRLMGLYGDEVWECAPNPDGSFEFPANAGAYLLLVVADREEGISIIDSVPVRIQRGERKSVSVDLKHGHAGSWAGSGNP